MRTPAGQSSPEQGPASGARATSLPVVDERREIDHRLANSLQLAADFLAFEQARLEDPRARAVLQQTAARMVAVGHLHRFLSAHKDAPNVNLEPFLTELCTRIVGSTGLSCSVDADPVIVPGETAQQLGIAINELAMNAAKHAYRQGEPGQLHVDCHGDGKILRLSVCDDGEGLGRDFSAEGATGLGLTIVRAVARQLKGSLEARDDHGARFTITIPLAAAIGPASRSFSPPT